jgi:hypothetical protein
MKQSQSKVKMLTDLNGVSLLAFDWRHHLIGSQETVGATGIAAFSIGRRCQFLNIREAVQRTAKVGLPTFWLRLITILENT